MSTSIATARAPQKVSQSGHDPIASVGVIISEVTSSHSQLVGLVYGEVPRLKESLINKLLPLSLTGFKTFSGFPVFLSNSFFD